MRVGFILVCSLVTLVGLGAALCTLSKYNSADAGNWVKCSNSSLREALDRGGEANYLAAVTISRSKIWSVPANAFIKNANLRALSLHDCGIRRLDPDAFVGLALLDKLSLSSNDITSVEPKWFASLSNLEQLDLSFNKIRNVEPSVFPRLVNLRRLDLDENLLTCLDPKDMSPLRSIAKIRVLENPLGLVCRGKMTLWFKDKGINYSSDLPASPSWLDRVLWLCAEDGYGRGRGVSATAGITDDEKTMRECVLFSVFDQLRSALKTTASYFASSGRCVSETRGFLQCLVRKTGNNESAGMTDAQAVTKIISNLRGVREDLDRM
ncbi:slit homolog 2 protein-like [Venturia canescens]|uniref:slit homolog 2 protein-like n=1 Tax=Venturia canescens TaxID=32260 RepID=UPI001C9C510A|nr:slit homolog 2 protein-like [Venturia canescens]